MFKTNKREDFFEVGKSDRFTEINGALLSAVSTVINYDCHGDREGNEHFNSCSCACWVIR